MPALYPVCFQELLFCRILPTYRGVLYFWPPGILVVYLFSFDNFLIFWFQLCKVIPFLSERGWARSSTEGFLQLLNRWCPWTYLLDSHEFSTTNSQFSCRNDKSRWLVSQNTNPPGHTSHKGSYIAFRSRSQSSYSYQSVPSLCCRCCGRNHQQVLYPPYTLNPCKCLGFRRRGWPHFRDLAHWGRWLLSFCD